MKIYSSGQQGFVLPMTLIVLALLTVLSMGLSQMARGSLEEVQGRKVLMKNELLVRSATQWSLYHLLTGVPDKRVVQSGEVAFPVDGQTVYWNNVEIKVQDSAGLLGLWYYKQERFQHVLEAFVPKQQALQLAARLGDWIDTDQRSRYRGMEADDYLKVGLPMFPRNAPLRSLDELLEIPGFSPELFNGHDEVPGLRDLLLAGGDELFNLATMPDVLIGPVLGVSDEKLRQILSLRKKGQWQALRLLVGSHAAFGGGEPFSQGFMFRIMVKTVDGFSGRSMYRLVAPKAVPYELILWQYPDHERG